MEEHAQNHKIYNFNFNNEQFQQQHWAPIQDTLQQVSDSLAPAKPTFDFLKILTLINFLSRPSGLNCKVPGTSLKSKLLQLSETQRATSQLHKLRTTRTESSVAAGSKCEQPLLMSEVYHGKSSSRKARTRLQEEAVAEAAELNLQRHETNSQRLRQ